MLHASVNLTSSSFCSIESDKLWKRLNRFTPKWTTSVTCLTELSATNEKHVASTNKIFSQRWIPHRKKLLPPFTEGLGKNCGFKVQPNDRGRMRTGSRYQREGRISGCECKVHIWLLLWLRNNLSWRWTLQDLFEILKWHLIESWQITRSKWHLIES
jgi:hypothetical protein